MHSITTPLSNEEPCYFSIPQPSYIYDHYTAETPSCSPGLSPIETPADPTNQLLAYGVPQNVITTTSTSTNNRPTLLQMQTSAAHGHSTSRPRPHPMQNVLLTSDDGVSSDGSTSSNDSAKSSFDVARCSRCQRTPSLDVSTGKSNMIQYGLNLWYCSRCAAIVGLNNR